jgi:transposase
VIFVGIDWAEHHHDVCLVDATGQVLATGRLPDGVQGVSRLHELVAAHAEDPAAVVVGIETDRGLLVGALTAAGYQVYGINPLQASRYRERHVSSGAKSDAADARVLAEIVRSDRHHHRRIAGDSDQAEAIKILARAHQGLIWARQRHVNGLRNALREFYPAALAALGTDLAGPEALAVLGAAPTPNGPRAAGDRDHGVAGPGRPATQPRQPRRPDPAGADQPPAGRASASHGRLRHVVTAAVKVLAELTTQINALEQELTSAFEIHPDAEILRSLPGLGVVLGARVLAEFGDDPTRYHHPPARKTYAGTAPSPCLWHPQGRPGPPGPQQAPGRCLLPVGLQRADPFPGRPGLLRPTPRPWRHPPPGPAGPGQPPGRHPPRLPTTPQHL